jgi:hypothetical protein
VSDRDGLPSEPLTPLARRILCVLARYGYELEAAVEAIDAAVPGIGGLFDSGTSRSEPEEAVEAVLAEPATASPGAGEAGPGGPPPEAVVSTSTGAVTVTPGRRGPARSFGTPTGPGSPGSVVRSGHEPTPTPRSTPPSTWG